MSPRLLGTLALLVVMAHTGSARGALFLWSVGASCAILLVRFQILPLLLEEGPQPRLRRNMNLGVAITLWLALLVQLVTQWVPTDVLVPLAVTTGVWFLLDQPRALIVDTFYVSLVALLAVLAPLVVQGSEASTVACLAVSGTLLLGAFSVLDKRRLRELTQRDGRPLELRTEWKAFFALSILSVSLGLAAPLHLGPSKKGEAIDASRRHRRMGFGDKMELGSMASFFPADAEMMRIRIKLDGDEWEEPLARVHGRPLLFRGQILDRFDGRTFHQRRAGASVPADREIALNRRKWFLKVEQDIQHVLLDFTRLYGLVSVRKGRHSHLVRRGSRGEIHAVGAEVADVSRYGLFSWVLDPLKRNELSRISVDRSRAYIRAYLGLGSASEFTRDWEALALDVTRGARGDFAKVSAVESFFVEDGGFVYSRHPPDGKGKPLDRFLFDSRTGYCEHFASAMTVMLRTLGIPARTVRGFRGGTWSPERQAFRVSGEDAHAWVEVPFEGLGWISFDPTPGRTRLDVAPEGVLPRADSSPGTPVTGEGASRFLAERLRATAAPLLVLLLLVFVLALAWLVSRRRQVEQKRARGDLVSLGFVSRMTDLLCRAGARRRIQATLNELLREAGSWPQEETGGASQMIRLLYRARFGGGGLSSDERLDVLAYLGRMDAMIPRAAPR